MEKLRLLSERVRGLSIVRAIYEAFTDGSVKAETLKLNKEQLNEGLGAKGQQLRTDRAIYPNVYAPFTIAVKQEKGQPFNKVTLKDTGKFHSSLKVQPFPGHAAIIGDTAKPDGDMEENIDVSSALGIMPDNMQELIMSVVTQMQNEIRKELRI